MADAGRLNLLSRQLEVALLLFAGACFALPTQAGYALVFYAAVLPCLAARLVTATAIDLDSSALPSATGGFAPWTPTGVPPASQIGGEPICDAGGTPVGGAGGQSPPPAGGNAGESGSIAVGITSLGVALIIWSGSTLLWGQEGGARAAGMALGALCTLAFWLALIDVLRNDRLRAGLARLLVGMGVADALIGFVRYFLWPGPVFAGDPKRLHGWGVTYHPVIGAAVFSVCLLTALDLALRDRRRRLLWLGAVAWLALAILLTESRGPAIAVCAAACVRLAAGPARRFAPAMLAIFPAGWLAWRAGLVRLGDSGHLQVWRQSWVEIRARPWFGHGLAADLPAWLGPDKSFPHDLYLSLLFYSGVVGLGLFGLWAGWVMWRLAASWALDEVPWCLALWVNALLAGLTDFGQITKGPGPLWWVLWLPASLSVCVTVPFRTADAKGQKR